MFDIEKQIALLRAILIEEATAVLGDSDDWYVTVRQHSSQHGVLEMHVDTLRTQDDGRYRTFNNAIRVPASEEMMRYAAKAAMEFPLTVRAFMPISIEIKERSGVSPRRAGQNSEDGPTTT